MKTVIITVTAYDTQAELDAGKPTRMITYESVSENGVGQSFTNIVREGKELTDDADLKILAASLLETAERLKTEDAK